jgi:hypothetical protein
MIAALDAGHYVARPGRLRPVRNTTCSGAFDGDHCIGIHPKKKVEAGVDLAVDRRPDLQDGPLGARQRPARYATKLWASIRFGFFLQPVPAAQHVAEACPRGRRASRLFTVEHTAKYPNGVIHAVQIRHDTSAIRKPCSAPRKYPWPGPSRLARVLVKLEDGPYIQSKFAHEAGS